jgi:hypothetical protein
VSDPVAYFRFLTSFSPPTFNDAETGFFPASWGTHGVPETIRGEAATARRGRPRFGRRLTPAKRLVPRRASTGNQTYNILAPVFFRLPRTFVGRHLNGA